MRYSGQFALQKRNKVGIRVRDVLINIVTIIIYRYLLRYKNFSRKIVKDVAS